MRLFFALWLLTIWGIVKYMRWRHDCFEVWYTLEQAFVAYDTHKARERRLKEKTC